MRKSVARVNTAMCVFVPANETSSFANSTVITFRSRGLPHWLSKLQSPKDKAFPMSRLAHSPYCVHTRSRCSFSQTVAPEGYNLRHATTQQKTFRDQLLEECERHEGFVGRVTMNMTGLQGVTGSSPVDCYEHIDFVDYLATFIPRLYSIKLNDAL